MTCPHCAGSGGCPVCLSFELDDPRIDADPECERCEGSGACPDCEGTGEVDDE